jgi:hypothetical protein
MLKVFSFLKRRADLDVRAFRDYYENHHAPLICSLAPPPLVYKRNYLERQETLVDGGATIAFDVVTEQVFANRAEFDAWLGALTAPGVSEQVRADETRFLDHAHYFAYFVEEHASPAA